MIEILWAGGEESDSDVSTLLDVARDGGCFGGG